MKKALKNAGRVAPVVVQIVLIEWFIRLNEQPLSLTATALKILMILNLLVLIGLHLRSLSRAVATMERQAATINVLVAVIERQAVEIGVLKAMAGAAATPMVLAPNQVVTVITQIPLAKLGSWVYMIDSIDGLPPRFILCPQAIDRDEFLTTHLKAVDEPNGRRRVITMHLDSPRLDEGAYPMN